MGVDKWQALLALRAVVQNPAYRGTVFFFIKVSDVMKIKEFNFRKLRLPCRQKELEEDRGR